jgi:signal transduction histidine kinase
MAKDKADLLAMLSHDIRNPLNAVMGVVQLLERSALADPQRRYVQLLKSSSDNILSLLDRVLQLSEAESSAFALREVPFAIRPIVDEVVSTFGAAADHKHLELRSSIDPAVPRMVIADPIALRQILTNLVGNAIKFTEAGAVTVTVEAREIAADSVTLAFAVADTGIGMAAAVLERIFDEFTQASYDTAARYGGTGLGLAIVRKLLALYDSRIHVVSEPGQGSTFSFSVRLPVPVAPE